MFQVNPWKLMATTIAKNCRFLKCLISASTVACYEQESHYKPENNAAHTFYQTLQVLHILRAESSLDCTLSDTN